MIIKPKGSSVNIVGIASTVADSNNIGATLVSLVNTQTAAVQVSLSPDGTDVYVAAGERVLIQKLPATTITVASGSAVWATNVGFTN